MLIGRCRPTSDHSTPDVSDRSFAHAPTDTVRLAHHRPGRRRWRGVEGQAPRVRAAPPGQRAACPSCPPGGGVATHAPPGAGGAGAAAAAGAGGAPRGGAEPAGVLPPSYAPGSVPPSVTTHAPPTSGTPGLRAGGAGPSVPATSASPARLPPSRQLSPTPQPRAAPPPGLLRPRQLVGAVPAGTTPLSKVVTPWKRTVY